MNEFLKFEQPHGLGYVNLRWQRGSGGYLATTGTDNFVAIYTRNGKLIERISLPGICVDFGWDRDGDMLAIVNLNSSNLILWDSNTQKKYQLDCGLRDVLSCVFWSKNEHTLAVATAKGNVCIYNHATSRRIPILGKHSKAIVCGSWNCENLLALGSVDRTVSISNAEGDTLKIISLRAEPSSILFSEMKFDERCPGENTVSVIVGKRTLFLYNLQDPDNPTELAFQNRYGNIVSYQWFGDGYILIGFSEGWVVSISTHAKEIGRELFQSKNHRDKLTDVAVSRTIGKVASCGDNHIKLYDINSLLETVAVVTIEDDGGVEKIAWSEDGQLLAAATAYGSVLVYLSKLPMLASSYANFVCLLSTLSRVTIHSVATDGNSHAANVSLETDIEPSFLGVGPCNVMVGMNNRIWFYDLRADQGNGDAVTSELKTPVFLYDKEYLGSVNSVRANADYASVLFEGRIHLHQIKINDTGENIDGEMKLFPNGDETFEITDHFLTPAFLIFVTNTGLLRYFSLEEWCVVIDYHHAEGIQSVHPNADGSNCLFMDLKNDGYVFNPANLNSMKIPRFPSAARAALWEITLAEKHVFVVYNSKTAFTYAYLREAIQGCDIRFVGESQLPNSYCPLLMCRGRLYCETENGKLVHFLLSTHQSYSSVVKGDPKTALEQSLSNQLALARHAEAWNLCELIDTKDCWMKLAVSVLNDCSSIEKAIKIYSRIQDVSAALLLKDLRFLDDAHLLRAHIFKFLGLFDRAQELYLESNHPLEALYMRQDILQWKMALKLAESLAPEQIPFICEKYGQQLEFMGRHAEALTYYEKGMEGKMNVDDRLISSCNAGVARNSIRCGDSQRGFKIATGAAFTKQLARECAEILENTKKLNEAAHLYELTDNFNQAAFCYIRLKNWTKIMAILPKITSGKIHAQFAKAMEALGNYKKAIAAFELAKDYDNVIRIVLERLNDVQEAVRIVQETRNIEGTKMVAKYFQKTGNFATAIKFLVMSACYNDAFQLACEHNLEAMYGEFLANEVPDEETRDEFLLLAKYFECKNDHFLAGKYFYHAKQFKQAANHLLAAAKYNVNNDEALSLSIDVVAASGDFTLANQLVELLLGEVDGEARDPKFIFRLYLAKGEFAEAAKTAVIIAQEEQINGNYKQAHYTLFRMCTELKQRHLKVNTEIISSLVLLHSYILATIHVKLANHSKAAILLIRVANNISKFPSHTVPILTSAVMECYRMNMKLTAFQFATHLMKPEYKQQMIEKYRKKIEGIIRKRPKGDQLTDDFCYATMPCPSCETPLTCDQLHCTSCQCAIPFCIATGWHITKTDLTACPSCNFPALHSELLRLLDSLNGCPMCGEKISKSDLLVVEDVKPYLYTQ